MAVYPIRNMYLEAIDRASERIWMTQGYLIPDDDVVAALHQLHLAGLTLGSSFRLNRTMSSPTG